MDSYPVRMYIVMFDLDVYFLGKTFLFNLDVYLFKLKLFCEIKKQEKGLTFVKVLKCVLHCSSFLKKILHDVGKV